MLNPQPKPTQSIFERVARVGVMGFIAMCIVITVCGLAVYTTVKGIQTDDAHAYHTVVQVAAGGVLVAAGKFFNTDNNDE